MSFSTVVDRVRGEFLEMPGMELTVAQAIKLWNLGADDCRFVLDALVDAGFLRWTARRTVIRTGRPWAIDCLVPAHVSVLKDQRRNKSVGHE